MRLAVLLCLAVLAAGCGAGGTDRPNEDASLLLDFTPNAVHAGIYLATERDYDGAEGVNLKVRAPGASTDALKLLEAGRVDMAILDIHDLALARENGARHRWRDGARPAAAGLAARPAEHPPAA